MHNNLQPQRTMWGLVLRQYYIDGVLMQESASSAPISPALIVPGVVAPRYMGACHAASSRLVRNDHTLPK